VRSPALAVPLAPHPMARPWGGRALAPRFGWGDTSVAAAGVSGATGTGRTSASDGAPMGAPIGEWWLASCHPAAATRLRDSPTTLAAWLDGPGQAFGLPASADFPLLLKFLDCEETLSVQVHPDDSVAMLQGLPCGKTEAWHILHAEPGACVWLGTAPGVRASDLLDAAAAGATDDQVLSMLRRVEVCAGDTLFVAGGTVHAIGPGLQLFEVQQSSDTTWRIHDWGRGRQVHLAEARQSCIDLPPELPRRARVAADVWTKLIDETAFGLRRTLVRHGLNFAPSGGFGFLVALAGAGTVSAADRVHVVRPGDTLLVSGEVTIAGEDLQLLAVDGPR